MLITLIFYILCIAIASGQLPFNAMKPIDRIHRAIKVTATRIAIDYNIIIASTPLPHVTLEPTECSLSIGKTIAITSISVGIALKKRPV